MLSDKVKKEMLEDARDRARRDNFRIVKNKKVNISFDEYLKALNDIQKIFSPFKIPTHVTLTRMNKI